MTHDPKNRAQDAAMFTVRELAHSHNSTGDDVTDALVRHLRKRIEREEEERDAEADRVHRERQAEQEQRLTMLGDD